MLTSLASRVIAAIVAGLLCGIALAAVGDPWASRVVAVVEPIGALWVAAIRMTVVPLVVSLLIVSVASVTDVGAVGRTGGRALLVFLALLIASACAAAVAAPMLLDLVPMEQLSADALGQSGREAAAAVAGNAERLPGVAAWIVGLVPVNPIRAAADGAMLPLVLFSLLFAVATTRVPAAERTAIVGLFRAISAAMLVLVRWVIALAPVGVFALMLALAARMGASAAGALGFYVLLVSLMLIGQTLLLYPFAWLAAGVPVRQFAAAALPAQAVAVSTRSSLAALPALIEGAEQVLKVPAVVAGFVLPLAVSTFKFSAPMSSVVGTLFVARLYQVDLAPLQVVFVAVAAVALSFSTPGIPAGNLVVLAPLFATLGLPIEGIGVLIALDVIPDTVKTTGNVTANLAVAALLSRTAAAAAPDIDVDTSVHPQAG